MVPTPFLIASGRNSLFEIGRYGRFFVASGRNGRSAIVNGRNDTFYNSKYCDLSRFQKILRFFEISRFYCGNRKNRDFTKYRGTAMIAIK